MSHPLRSNVPSRWQAARMALTSAWAVGSWLAVTRLVPVATTVPVLDDDGPERTSSLPYVLFGQGYSLPHKVFFLHVGCFSTRYSAYLSTFASLPALLSSFCLLPSGEEGGRVGWCSLSGRRCLPRCGWPRGTRACGGFTQSGTRQSGPVAGRPAGRSSGCGSVRRAT